jgi:hypothetical protein
MKTSSTPEAPLFVFYILLFLYDFTLYLYRYAKWQGSPQGITDIVRIGSRSKSEVLQQYNLRELASSKTTTVLSGSERWRFSTLIQEKQTLEGRLENMRERLARSNPSRRASDAWGDMDTFLRENHRDIWEQLQVRSSGTTDDGMKVRFPVPLNSRGTILIGATLMAVPGNWPRLHVVAVSEAETPARTT